ncbi:MAG: family 20 glycosylhydrolase [Agriterribacter sp.]
MLSKNSLLVCATLLLFSTLLMSQTINVIPLPKQVTGLMGKTSAFPSLQYWLDDKTIQPAIDGFKDQLSKLSFIAVRESRSAAAANMQVSIDKALNENQYSINIQQSIVVKGGSYQAVAWAMASLLQMASVKNKTLVWQQLRINDQPDLAYRGLLVDVARQWHEASTLRTIVDICGFYKIPYLQLHLTDDQSFTFPSKAFPQLATPGRHYTEKELNDLVSYAHARGVSIVPEMDLPGHSTAMRRAMPELFGNADLRVIDLNKPQVYEAVKTLTKEMSDIFHTSPYIHIGADECNFELFEKLPATQNTIKQKGYNNVHDILLEYIIEMNEYVKSLGKKTLMWESFKGKGTPYLTVPDDILIFAWETLYQRPDSLLDNGYTIMNASWKPLYITPGYRWGAKFIYDQWNISKWENWWDAAPSYHAIQLPDNNRIIGAQYCSWEMANYMEVPEILARMPAYSEKIWNKSTKLAYKAFDKNSVLLNQKLQRLLYAGDLTVTGVLKQVEHEIEYLENTFTDFVRLDLRNLPAGYFATFTTNGARPRASSSRFRPALQFDSSVNLQFAIFNAAQEEIGYYHNQFKKVPLAFSINGTYELPGNVNVMNPPSIVIKEPVTVKVLFSKTNQGMVKYKISEKDKPGTLVLYNAHKGFVADRTCTIEAFIEDKDGKLTERSVLNVRLQQ